jgi:hypothetical protein
MFLFKINIIRSFKLQNVTKRYKNSLLLIIILILIFLWERKIIFTCMYLCILCLYNNKNTIVNIIKLIDLYDLKIWKVFS